MSYTYEYPRPAVTVDALIFAGNISDLGSVKVLLIARKNEPFKGMWAIPGGFVDMDEDLKSAAMRELEEETTLTGVELTQFKTYGAIGRDPRHRTVSVVYIGFVGKEVEVKAMDDAADIGWFSIEEMPLLAFDHHEIVEEVIAQLS